MYVRRISVLLAVVFMAMAGAPTRADAGGTRGTSTHAPGELLVAPAADVTASELEHEYTAFGARRLSVIPGLDVHHIQVPEAALTAIEAALERNPKFRYVERNGLASGGLVPSDPAYLSQWHLPKIGAPGAWDLSPGSSGVAIAVLDSGIDPTHPDLTARLGGGWNFLLGNSDTHDVLGHGTTVAGAAAATGNNGLGVTGVSWRSTLVPYVVLNGSNVAKYSDIAAAITRATAWIAPPRNIPTRIRVVTISIGGTTYSSTMQSAVNYAWSRGVVIVAAAMNAATSTPNYPAALDNVVAVGATDEADRLASFSSYGSWIDVTAPGISIYSTANGGGYRFASGTSLATPLVAGLAALMFSANPSLTNADVVRLLRESADDRGPAGFDPYFGWGRINAARAVTRAADTLASVTAEPAPAPSPDPTEPAAGPSTPLPTISITGVTSARNELRVDMTASSVVRVELYVDGKLAGTDRDLPWKISVSTKGWDTAERVLQAYGYDALGRSVASSPVRLSK